MDPQTETLLRQIITGMDAGFAHADHRIDALDAKMDDRFQSMDERLRSVERDIAAFTLALAANTGMVGSLTERISALEKRTDIMSDDMRQRFRVVIERLAALEQRPPWK